MRRVPLLAAPLLLASLAAKAQPAATWQVETLLPAACVAANLPTPDCLCLLDALERQVARAEPAAVTGGPTGIPPRAGHAEAVAAALRACAPAATTPGR